jgi:hypothetical protein
MVNIKYVNSADQLLTGNRIFALTVVFMLFIYYLLQQSSVALPSFAGITTLSTAAAIWIQNLYPPVPALAPPDRPRNTLGGSIELH